MNVQQLQQEFEHARSRAAALLSRASSPPSPTEQAGIQAAIDEAKTLRGRLDHALGDANMTAEINRLTAGMASPSHQGGGLSLGAQFINSDTFKWLKANKGILPQGAWTSPAAELPGFGPMMAATLTEDAASGGDLVLTDFQSGILPLPSRPLRMADLIAPGTTTSNAVGYMKETTATNAAATVAEGIAKPESTLIFDAVSDPVRKIATWLPVTEEMLEDVPALRAYLDTRLRLFVLLVEDDQLLNGDGTAPNISGILDRAGIATPIARGGAEVNPDAILRQISAIETATSLPVDGIVVHPTNWDTMLLLKDANGGYIAGGGPFATPQRKTLWGRDVAVTTAITVNTALVGAFKTAAQFFRKGGLRVEASNSHASFFIENKIAIRAEERGALCVYRESAFGKVTGLN
jgi:HK97 family phage major capsid protein